MRLLKIGQNPACDIVISDPYVSNLHAELLLLDNGEMMLTDQYSKNGTTKAGQPLTPGAPCQVKRYDNILFAGRQTLNWQDVPDMRKELQNYKAAYNIGKDRHCDIPLGDQHSSRVHAMLLIDKSGKAYVKDMKSTNGVSVNGVKIRQETPVRVKRGYNVVCGGEDVTEEIKNYIPASPLPKLLAIAGAVVAVAVGGWLAFGLIPSSGNYDNEVAKAISKDGAQVMRSAVVSVVAKYHYDIVFQDNPLHSDIWDGRMEDKEMTWTINGTAFFVDREGRMMTNRHVAFPWENAQAREQQTKELMAKWEPKMQNIFLPSFTIDSDEAWLAFLALVKQGYPLETYTYQDAVKYSGWNNNLNKLVNYINTLVREFRKSKYVFEGVIDEIYVAYPGQMYTHYDDMARCTPVGDSGTADIDLGVLQLNTKRTPEEVKYIFDINYFREDSPEPLKEKFYAIGYPLGLSINIDEKINSLEPDIRETQCSKVASKYEFQIQVGSDGGSSGSPVFDEKGRVAGVLYGGYDTKAAPTFVCLGKYAKEVYAKAK